MQSCHLSASVFVRSLAILCEISILWNMPYLISPKLFYQNIVWPLAGYRYLEFRLFPNWSYPLIFAYTLYLEVNLLQSVILCLNHKYKFLNQRKKKMNQLSIKYRIWITHNTRHWHIKKAPNYKQSSLVHHSTL